MKDNDNKQLITLAAIDPREAPIPQPIEKADKKGLISFGENNDYPEFLYGLYSECSLLQSIINGLVDYVCGSGFEDEGKADMVVNRKGQTLLDVVKPCVTDYVIFGAFAVEIIRNQLGQVLDIYWRDLRRFRLDEDETHVYYHKSWDRYSRDIKKLDRWQGEEQLFDRSIYYFKRPQSRGDYGLPMWNSATRDVTIAIEITKFHLSAILNNFVPSAIVNFNDGVPPQEQRKEIERKLNEKFSGSTNAARLLVSFNQSKEGAVTINRLSEDNFDQRYQALAKSTKDNIFVAFRAQPQLFGTDPDRTGFNSQEYAESFKLFKKTVVAPIQSEIERAFAAIGEAFEFRLKEFEIDFDNMIEIQLPVGDQQPTGSMYSPNPSEAIGFHPNHTNEGGTK